MNWGYKILIVIVLFIIGMGTMVSIAMRQKNEMIDEQYYVKELKHQGQIDAENNLNALDEKLTIKDTLDALVVKIPSIARQNIKEGSVVFLRPSDQSKDRRLVLNVDSSGSQLFNKSNFVKGQYKVRISWKSAQKAYYYEQPLFVH
jgi:nitrogen fixation protein FixH